MSCFRLAKDYRVVVGSNLHNSYFGKQDLLLVSFCLGEFSLLILTFSVTIFVLFGVEIFC